MNVENPSDDAFRRGSQTIEDLLKKDFRSFHEEIGNLFERGGAVPNSG
jgi:hypothetical protein